MKLWEVFKELVENPEKIFKNGIGENQLEITGTSPISFYVCGFAINVDLQEEWHEKKPKVDIVKAMEHMKSGNSAKYNNQRYTVMQNSLARITDDWKTSISCTITPDMCIGAKWELD